MSMIGQHFIQQSTLLRGQGYYSEAIATIEENIDDISKELHSTAWHEAQFAAEAMGASVLAKIHYDKAIRAGNEIDYLCHFQVMPAEKMESALYTM